MPDFSSFTTYVVNDKTQVLKYGRFGPELVVSFSDSVERQKWAGGTGWLHLQAGFF